MLMQQRRRVAAQLNPLNVLVCGGGGGGGAQFGAQRVVVGFEARRSLQRRHERRLRTRARVLRSIRPGG